ncbi:MAG: CBS domain-containing protein [Deltaproteobacteria bacterium]|nr:CBS domain-containing protein [Candidatus Anaeroferrophillus wilburensis]MBN2889110.1 CBS domain-containing protein [Deltaproteobacteria bacterium]
MSVGKFCNRDVVIVEPTATIVEAARLMRHHHVGGLVVVDQQGSKVEPIGIVTDRDMVVSLIAEQIDISLLTVSDLMSGELISAVEHDSLWDTMQRMVGGGIRRLPVVSDDGSLVGIIAVDDILELLADEMGALVRIIQSEQAKERELKV